MNIKHYFLVYRTLLIMNFSTLVGFRANFINSILASLAWGFFSLYSIVVLTFHSKTIFGWERNELLLLNGFYGIFISLYHVIFSRNFSRFSEIVHLGHLDSILLKPMDSQFLVSFWLFGFATLSRTIIAVMYTVYMMQILHIPFSFIHLSITIFVAILGLATLYSVWFFVTTVTIWFSRLSNLTELLFAITGTARYPQEIIRQVGQYVFLFLFPLTLIITLPTKAYLHRLGMNEFLTIAILAISLFMLSRFFWRFALRYYTSASS